MQIGKVAQLTGLSKDTIRWYEKIGLIQLNEKLRGENNYRIYSNENVTQLKNIKKLKSLGFTLKDIDWLQLLDKHDSLQCISVAPIVNKRIQVIENKITELEQLKSRLLQSKSLCEGDCNAVLYHPSILSNKY